MINTVISDSAAAGVPQKTKNSLFIASKAGGVSILLHTLLIGGLIVSAIRYPTTPNVMADPMADVMMIDLSVYSALQQPILAQDDQVQHEPQSEPEVITPPNEPPEITIPDVVVKKNSASAPST